MSRLIRFVVVFSLLTASLGLADTVYLSYTDVSITSTPTSAGMMMKLDEQGNILKGPTVVLPPASCGGDCLLNMSDDGSGRLILVAATEILPLTGNSIPYQSFLVNQNTLAATKSKKLGIGLSVSAFPGSQQATQQSSPRFVVLETKGENALAFGLTDKGKLDGSQWRVDPRISHSTNLQVGVAPDGRFAWAINFISGANPPLKLYGQPLDSKGRPDDDPNVSASSNAGLVISADVTNILNSGRRLLSYTEVNFSPTVRQTVKTQLIDGATGERIGSAKTVSENASSIFVQNLALDPKGRFMFYTGFDTSCKKEVIYFVRLNSSGEPSSSPKTIVGCDDIVGAGATVLDAFVE